MGARWGTKRQLAFCLTKGKFSPPDPLPNHLHLIQSLLQKEKAISCPHKTGVSSVVLYLLGGRTFRKSPFLYHAHISHPSLSHCSSWYQPLSQWKHKILLLLLLASSLGHVIPFPLVPFMVPVCCLFKCWLSAVSWTFSKFPRWFLSPKSLSWAPSQPLAEADDEVDNHLALNKQLKYALSALKPSPCPFSRHLPALHSLQSMKNLHY